MSSLPNASALCTFRTYSSSLYPSSPGYPTDSCRTRECHSLGHTAPLEHLLANIWDTNASLTRTWIYLTNDEVTSSTLFQGICRQCSTYILQYYTVVNHRIHQQPLSANDFIIYVNRPALPGSPPPVPHIYLAIFGWVSPTTLSHCRADVRDGYSRYMNLVHKIARKLLLANTQPPTPPNLEYDPGHYRTFNPTLSRTSPSISPQSGTFSFTSWSTLLSTSTTRSVRTIWSYLKVS